jgi:hypothetical protein
MIKLFGSNWKTSLLGLMSGCGLILQDFMERGVTDIYRILVAICVYLLGRFAADNSKSEVK